MSTHTYSKWITLRYETTSGKERERSIQVITRTLDDGTKMVRAVPAARGDKAALRGNGWRYYASLGEWLHPDSSIQGRSPLARTLRRHLKEGGEA